MITLKKVFGLGMAFVFLLSMGAIAEASYFTSGMYNNRDNDYSHFWGFDNYNKQENDNWNYGYGSSDNYANSGFSRSGSTQDVFGEGFLNSNYGSFNQKGIMDYNDNVNLNKGCQSLTENFNGNGKAGDYVKTTTFCDGYTGTISKSNRYYNNVDNDFGYNQNNAGLNYYNNDFNEDSYGQVTNKDSRGNVYGNSNYAFGESTSFGKGSRIIFY
jgi:hypothetical protein